MKHKATKKNFNQVIDNIKNHFNDNQECQKDWVQWLNDYLDELLNNDFLALKVN